MNTPVAPTARDSITWPNEKCTGDQTNAHGSTREPEVLPVFQLIKAFIVRAWVAFRSSIMEFEPTAAFVLGTVGIVVCALIMILSNPAYVSSEYGPKLAINLVLMTLLFETYLAATPPTIRSFGNVSAIVRRYDPHAQLFVYRANPRFWCLMALFYILDLAPFVWLASFLPVDRTKYPHGVSVTLFLTFVGASAAFFISCLVWQVDAATRVLFPNQDTVRAYRHAGGTTEVNARSQRLIVDYLELRGELIQSLTLLGLMVSLLTLTIGAFRYCNREYDPSLYQKFEPQLVLMIGVYYSVFVGLVLVPPYLRLTEAGRVLRDTLLRPVGAAPQSAAEFLDLRKKFEDALFLGVGPTEAFRNAILVLSPLISGVVPLLVGLGTPDKKDEAVAPDARVTAPVSPAPKAAVPAAKSGRTSPPKVPAAPVQPPVSPPATPNRRSDAAR
jgi:hypothetical protein